MTSPQLWLRAARIGDANVCGRAYRTLAGNPAGGAGPRRIWERRNIRAAVVSGKLAFLLEKIQGVMMKLHDKEEVKLHQYSQPHHHLAAASDSANCSISSKQD